MIKETSFKEGDHVRWKYAGDLNDPRNDMKIIKVGRNANTGIDTALCEYVISVISQHSPPIQLGGETVAIRPEWYPISELENI